MLGYDNISTIQNDLIASYFTQLLVTSHLLHSLIVYQNQ